MTAQDRLTKLYAETSGIVPRSSTLAKDPKHARIHEHVVKAQHHYRLMDHHGKMMNTLLPGHVDKKRHAKANSFHGQRAVSHMEKAEKLGAGLVHSEHHGVSGYRYKGKTYSLA